MKNQDYHNIENLLTNDEFYEWIKGTASDAQCAKWQTWLAQNPQNERLYAQAKLALIALEQTDMPLTQQEIDAETKRILQTTHTQIDPKQNYFPTRNWVIAASFAGLLAIIYWFFTQQAQKNYPSVTPPKLAEIIDIQKVTNDTIIQFSDGSKAHLKRGSSLQFDKNFVGSQRAVTLIHGEAFFEVTKNTAKPFVVFANDLVTKVVGTSFIVKTANVQGGTSSVVVRSGEVVIFKKADFIQTINTTPKDSILLLPNQQVTQKLSVAPLVASLAEMPVLIEKPAENPDFTFDNAPVAAIFATLEKAYRVEIKADEAILKSCRLNISLGNQDALFDKLKVICKVIGAHYEVADTTIRIIGKGCVTQ